MALPASDPYLALGLVTEICEGHHQVTQSFWNECCRSSRLLKYYITGNVPAPIYAATSTSKSINQMVSWARYPRYEAFLAIFACYTDLPLPYKV